MAKKILSTLLVLAFFALQSLGAFDVTVFPNNSKGGEGFLIRVEGKQKWKYKLTYNNKTYKMYGRKRSTKELALPIPIEDKGKKQITITEYRGKRIGEIEEFYINVKKRYIKTLKLSKSDVKMRKADPLISKQQKRVKKAYSKISKKKYWNGKFIRPTDGVISSPFAGFRRGGNIAYFHKGVDFADPEGTPVKASNSGKIIACFKDLNVYGNALFIDHGQGIVSVYFHLSKVLKKRGKKVTKGEIIGFIGSTGWATGPHLHFGIYVQGQAVDPLRWIKLTKKISSAEQTMK